MNAKENLAAFVADWESAEADPYSYAATIINVVCEYALDDGIVGAMNTYENRTLTAIRDVLHALDPALKT